MENIDLTKLDIKELKALAYDHLAQLEAINLNLKNINNEIAKRYTKPEVPQESEIKEVKE